MKLGTIIISQFEHRQYMYIWGKCICHIYLMTTFSRARRRMWRYIEAAATSLLYKRLQHDILTLLWRKGCNKVARCGSFCPPEELFQLPLVGAFARCARTSVCASCDTWTLGSTPPRVNVRTRAKEREREREREKRREKRERDGRVEGFVLINITSPARAAQLKSVSASAPPKYSYLSLPQPSSVIIIRLRMFSFILTLFSLCTRLHLGLWL